MEEIIEIAGYSPKEKLSIAELKIVIDESEKMRKSKLKQVAEKVLKNKIIELSK